MSKPVPSDAELVALAYETAWGMEESLPRIVLARLSLRLVCWLMLAGERLAPEVTRD